MWSPYALFRCPCADVSDSPKGHDGVVGQAEGEVEQEKSLDPRSRRSNFSLYPLGRLMWCDDCHDIKCAKCTVEEVVAWYCPNCLFEASSSMVKSEGNRCTRNCFTCPSCTAPMSVVALDADAGGNSGPWILACDYCNWTTLDAGIEFEKPVSLFSQLAKIDPTRASKGQFQSSSRGEKGSEMASVQDADTHFASLRSFYSPQIPRATPSNPFLSPQGDINYNSPSSLARIMSLYTGANNPGKKGSARPTLMREAADAGDGLVQQSPSADANAIKKLCAVGWEGTTSIEQRNEQPYSPLFLSSLRPVPTLLHTKRSKRCRACRHILVKPDPRIQNLRYRIRLVALNYVPSITVKAVPVASAAPGINMNALPASRALQFLLTLQNPMFDPVKVALAAQPLTPGRFGSRVTLLCPQFEIGANADVWDEALDGDSKKAVKSSKGKAADESGEGRIAEAGKVWSRGRNWATVVLEVVCAQIDRQLQDLDVDEDVLEVPILVRIEYDTEVGGQEGATTGSGRERKEKREMTYWTILGLGKIAAA